MSRLTRFVPFVLFAVLAAGLYAGLQFREQRAPDELRSALIGKPFPAFALPELHAWAPLQASDITAGEVTLVNIWGSWCPTCRFEHPYLEDLAQRGLRVVGINYKDDPQLAVEWLQRFGDPYALIVHDFDGSLGIDLGVYGAPENFLVDADGVIRYKRVGMVDDRVWSSEIEPLYLELGGRPLRSATGVTP